MDIRWILGLSANESIPDWYYTFDWDYEPPLADIKDQLRPILFDISQYVLIILSTLGIVSNVTNIVVFYRQGILSDSCTPSLVALAVSDLLICVSAGMLWFHYFVTQSLYNVLPKWLVHQFESCVMVIFIYPRQFYIQMTCYNTVYIALERAISVTFPIQFKSIFTPKRSCLILVGLVGVNFILQSTILLEHKLVYEQLGTAEPNVTYLTPIIDLMFFDFHEVALLVNNLILRPACIFLVLVFNAIIIVKVNFSLKFRSSEKTRHKVQQPKSATTPSGDHTSGNEVDEASTNHKLPLSKKSGKEKTKSISPKELKLIRMMVALCTMFFICYFPYVVQASLEYNPTLFYDRYINIHWLIGELSSYLEAFNSSSNIVIYLLMSTRYRTEFQRLFKYCGGKSS